MKYELTALVNSLNDRFDINSIHWVLEYVNPYNPFLIDRTGRLTLGTTDPIIKRVYVSNGLRGFMLRKVIMHELAHCALVSYNLLDDLHRMVKPECLLEAEESLCNFIADYGLKIVRKGKITCQKQRF